MREGGRVGGWKWLENDTVEGLAAGWVSYMVF